MVSSLLVPWSVYFHYRGCLRDYEAVLGKYGAPWRILFGKSTASMRPERGVSQTDPTLRELRSLVLRCLGLFKLHSAIMAYQRKSGYSKTTATSAYVESSFSSSHPIYPSQTSIQRAIYHEITRSTKVVVMNSPALFSQCNVGVGLCSHNASAHSILAAFSFSTLCNMGMRTFHDI